MGVTYWSVEECLWVAAGPQAELYWSVPRCRWEPLGPAADARSTPWSMFQAEPPIAAVPQQRERTSAPAEA